MRHEASWDRGRLGPSVCPRSVESAAHERTRGLVVRGCLPLKPPRWRHLVAADGNPALAAAALQDCSAAREAEDGRS
eukprot:13135381-Alexandrium_andersonii.AAC.1